MTRFSPERSYGLGWQPAPPDGRDFLAAFYMDPRWKIGTTPRLWTVTRVLNQAQTQHCVGFSGADWCNTLPVDDHYVEANAHDLYYACKVLDGQPHAENGSDLRSLAKVLQTRHRLHTYAFAQTIGEVKLWILNRGPVIVGTRWYAGMFKPDAQALVRISGKLVGGHAYLLIGYDPTTDTFTFLNSWGEEWGDKGTFTMKAGDWGKLLVAGGEALVAVELPTL